MIKLKFLIAPILGLFALSSCSDSLLPSPESNEKLSKADLIVSLQVSDPKTVMVRSGSLSSSEIQSIDAIVFDENKLFLSREKIDLITFSEGMYKFRIQLNETHAPRYIHLIATGHNELGDRIDFSHLQAGVSEDRIGTLQTAVLTQSDIASIYPHIMWGKLNLSSVQNGTKIPPVKLIRCTAAIDLEVSDLVLNNGSNFRLLGLTAHNASANGYVTPYEYSSSEAVPSLSNISFEYAPVSYTDTDGNGHWIDAVNNSCQGLYIYEANGENEIRPPARSISSRDGDDGISFIIKAMYNGEICFYKVVPVIDEYAISFVRNHRYKMQIIKVDGKGYATLEEAKQHSPANIIITIYDRDERIVNYVSGAGHFLGTTLTELNLFTNTLNACRLFDVIADPEDTSVGLFIENESVKQLLRLESSKDPDGFYGSFQVKGTTLSPFTSQQESAITLINQYGTLKLSIPLFINPSLSLRSDQRFPLIAQNVYKEWSLKLKASSPLGALLNIYKNDILQEGEHHTGLQGDKLELQLKNDLGEFNSDLYIYAEIGGVSVNGEVFHKLIVIRCSL